MKNKHGWLKIVEAFAAVLLILIVVLIVLNRTYIEKKDISKNIYETQIEILRGIVSGHRDWISSNDIASINNEVESRTPNYLFCEANLCDLELEEGEECNPLSGEPADEENLYVQTAIILDGNDKQLKLFCWVK